MEENIEKMMDMAEITVGLTPEVAERVALVRGYSERLILAIGNRKALSFFENKARLDKQLKALAESKTHAANLEYDGGTTLKDAKVQKASLKKEWLYPESILNKERALKEEMEAARKSGLAKDITPDLDIKKTKKFKIVLK